MCLTGVLDKARSVAEGVVAAVLASAVKVRLVLAVDAGGKTAVLVEAKAQISGIINIGESNDYLAVTIMLKNSHTDPFGDGSSLNEFPLVVVVVGVFRFFS